MRSRSSRALARVSGLLCCRERACGLGADVGGHLRACMLSIRCHAYVRAGTVHFTCTGCAAAVHVDGLVSTKARAHSKAYMWLDEVIPYGEFATSHA